MYKYKEAINILISRFPELIKVYEENFDDYEELPYVFYESVFVKFILDKTNPKDDDKLKAIFILIEDMFVNGDKETKNLIGVAIIESLYYEEDLKTKEILLSYFGKLTKKNYEDCFLIQ
jgi:hypothetical protein